MFWKKNTGETATIFDATPAEDVDLNAAHAALMERLAAKKAADLEALEKPAGPYRVIKVEYPPRSQLIGDKTPMPSSGWYVQQWRTSSYGYGEHDDGFYAAYRPARASIFDKTYDLKHLTEERARSYIIWDNVFQSAFPSQREAERFLKRWLKPDPGTIYDADGEPVPPA